MDKFFPNHNISTLSKSETFQRVVYRKPDTSFECMEFLIHGNSLIVLGDYGEAVYSFSERINFEFLSTCYLDYFHKKCKAYPESCNHQRFMTWNEKKAQDTLKSLDIDSNFNKLSEKVLKECFEEAYEYEAWKVFLDGNFGEYFGYYFEEPEEIYAIGLEIHPWCQNHWKALQDIGKILMEEDKDAKDSQGFWR